ncbi:MAG: hypothetical protein ACRDKS_16575 [Actinomycetota bacterium]
MNLPFAAAGVLALAGAFVHGIAGEATVVTKLSPESLPSSRFGGSSTTKLMIRATWHITTIAFLVIGSALMACAPDVSSQACRGVGRVAAISYSGFAALTIGLTLAKGPKGLLRHPAPLLFSLVATLAWWGAR